MTLIAATARRRTAAPPSQPINLVVDGNSISTAAYSSIGTLDIHLRQHAPLDAAVDQSSCAAVSGHGWDDMQATHGTVVDAAYSANHLNILVTWETRNSLVTGSSVAETLADIAAYTSDRRAAHPGWLILYVQTIPTGGSSTYATLNANMETIDSAVAGDLAAYGFDATVSIRTHPSMDHDGTTAAPFAAYASYWHETGVPYTHPRDPGKAVITPTIAAAVADLAGL